MPQMQFRRDWTLQSNSDNVNENCANYSGAGANALILLEMRRRMWHCALSLHDSHLHERQRPHRR